MPLNNEPMTVGMFMEILQNMDAADDLLLKVGEPGGGAYGIYSVRKHEVTMEDGSEGESYVVINA